MSEDRICFTDTSSFGVRFSAGWADIGEGRVASRRTLEGRLCDASEKPKLWRQQTRKYLFEIDHTKDDGKNCEG